MFFGNSVEIRNLIMCLLFIMGFDILTGLMYAFTNKTVRSSKWINGIIRKFLMIVCISFSYYLDKYGLINGAINLEGATTLFFIGGEVISVLENFVLLGIPLPAILIKFLEKNKAPINPFDGNTKDKQEGV